jgi:hypothetical protein
MDSFENFKMKYRSLSNRELLEKYYSTDANTDGLSRTSRFALRAILKERGIPKDLWDK